MCVSLISPDTYLSYGLIFVRILWRLGLLAAGPFSFLGWMGCSGACLTLLYTSDTSCFDLLVAIMEA
uniref:Uncharacterized protein n=1 Tax=Arundo donax TaxID=35708 RepID=A0A0A8ZUG4_ARUDO